MDNIINLLNNVTHARMIFNFSFSPSLFFSLSLLFKKIFAYNREACLIVMDQSSSIDFQVNPWLYVYSKIHNERIERSRKLVNRYYNATGVISSYIELSKI